MLTETALLPRSTFLDTDQKGERKKAGYGLVFPGQGSQYIGMGSELCRRSDAARRVFDTVDRLAGFPVSKLCFEDPKGELIGPKSRTDKIQLACLANTLATLAHLRANGVVDEEVVAGHSLGKVLALMAEGALGDGPLGLEGGVQYIGIRGEDMRQSSEQLQTGVVLVKGEDEQSLRDKLGKIDQLVSVQERLAEFGDRAHTLKITVINNLRQILAGGLQRHLDLLKEVGINFKDYSGRACLSHHELLALAQENTNKVLERLTIRKPQIPVLDDISDEVITTAESTDRALRSHLVNPLNWRPKMAIMEDMGLEIIEVGGSLLRGIALPDHPNLKFNIADTWENIQEVCERFGTPRVSITV